MNHAPDVVYILKDKSQYEELRYSLRSLKNAPHRNVIIAGAKPDWLKGCIHLPVKRLPLETNMQNAERNLMKACNYKSLSDEFISMNDDFFIMKPVESVEYFHDGDLKTCIDVRSAIGLNIHYEVAMRATHSYLVNKFGIEHPVGYLLHTPMILNKHKRIQLNEMFQKQIDNDQIILMRTVYGNIYEVGGTFSKDIKIVTDRSEFDETYLSTNDPSFKYEPIGEFIRASFPDKSPYEI